jgi:hypothetical protein
MVTIAGGVIAALEGLQSVFQPDGDFVDPFANVVVAVGIIIAVLGVLVMRRSRIALALALLLQVGLLALKLYEIVTGVAPGSNSLGFVNLLLGGAIAAGMATGFGAIAKLPATVGK